MLTGWCFTGTGQQKQPDQLVSAGTACPRDGPPIKDRRCQSRAGKPGGCLDTRAATPCSTPHNKRMRKKCDNSKHMERLPTLAVTHDCCFQAQLGDNTMQLERGVDEV